MNLPTVTRAEWAERINARWQTSLTAIFETGRLIAAAKEALDHGEFLAMVETDLPFGARASQMLMKVAADLRLTDAKHASHLPVSWATLHELTKLDDETFEARIADGTIRPEMERRDVINGARAVMGSRLEPPDSLDYFPTPPWATRALCDLVLGFDICTGQALDHRPVVWEPAAGEGHIAEVLREYFSGAVFASDVHDYGAGYEVGSFIDEGSGALTHDVDWIITNPPFGDRAIPFTLRALELARVGVAMFFRSQWIVEGTDRYERLFRENAPSLIAFFSERVPLVKGRWDPDASTATAYCWAVWRRADKNFGSSDVMWIPPGQRDRFTFETDRARFTQHPVAGYSLTKAATNIPEIIPSAALPAEIKGGGSLEQILEHELEAAGPALAPVDTATSPDIAGEDDRRKVVMAGDFQTQPTADVGDGGLVANTIAPTSADLEIPTFLRRGHPDCFVKAPG